MQVVGTSLREVKTALLNNWQGCMMTKNGFFVSRKYENIEINDRVGGGDSSASGLIWGMLNGHEEQQVIDFATAFSALCHTIRNDWNLVTRAEAETLAAGGSARVKRSLPFSDGRVRIRACPPALPFPEPASAEARLTGSLCTYIIGKEVVKMLGDHLLGIYEKAFNPQDSWTERLKKAKALGFNYVEISMDESDERLQRLRQFCAPLPPAGAERLHRPLHD